MMIWSTQKRIHTRGPAPAHPQGNILIDLQPSGSVVWVISTRSRFCSQNARMPAQALLLINTGTLTEHQVLKLLLGWVLCPTQVVGFKPGSLRRCFLTHCAFDVAGTWIESKVESTYQPCKRLCLCHQWLVCHRLRCLLSWVARRCRTWSHVACYDHPLARRDGMNPFQAGVMVGMWGELFY